jgi:predicted DNA-binding protein (MmcQ/YjbR family)
MARTDPVLARIRKFCLSLPDTSEKIAWGHPTFRVGGNAWFASCGEELQGRMTVSFKLEAPRAEMMEKDPRFVKAGTLGRHRVISIDAALIDDWADVEDMIRESHRLAAPAPSTRGKR